ncbi:PaaI family thioesterase [Corynebacterium glyciniphilum]|uniref:PaaI family thioesterase n=1 Tax=Corynebacterium glyciniphilum TaxID=1404244 RepID=UPI0023528B5A
MAQSEGRTGTGNEGAGQEDGALERMLELMTSASTGELTEAQTAELAGIFESSIPSLDRTLGLRYVEFVPEVVVELTITGDHVQPWGITNGGIYATMGESAGSFAGFIAGGGGMVMGTTNATNFLRPSTPGDVIRSTAHAVHTGRTSQLWRIDHVNAGTGKLCATTELRTVVVPRQ